MCADGPSRRQRPRRCRLQPVRAARRARGPCSATTGSVIFSPPRTFRFRALRLCIRCARPPPLLHVQDVDEFAALQAQYRKLQAMYDALKDQKIQALEAIIEEQDEYLCECVCLRVRLLDSRTGAALCR